MNKQLKNLFFFVKEKLQLLTLSFSIPADEILKWVGYLEITKDHILEELELELFNLDSPTKVELFIKNYHSMLITIINAVTHQSMGLGVDLPVVIKTFYQQVTATLQQLLLFSEVQHAQISVDLEAPTTMVEFVRGEISEKVHAVRKLLTEKDNVRLLRTILVPIDDFLEDEEAVYYQRLHYFKGLIDEVEGLRNNAAINRQLREILIRWNVNSEDALLYLKGYFEQQLIDAESPLERLDLLAIWKKQVNQVVVKKQVALESGEESVHAFLTKFFQEEEAFILRLQQAFTTSPSIAPSTAQLDTSTGNTITKVHTSMNLSELAGFIKVLIEANIFVNDVVLDPLRVIADTFSSSNKETLKFDSLRTKFYNIDANTGRTVIDICSRIAATARQCFK